jgi:hypothetical protein
MFNHKVRYVDSKGVKKTIVTKKFYYTVTNCGHVYAKNYRSYSYGGR